MFILFSKLIQVGPLDRQFSSEQDRTIQSKYYLPEIP